MFRDSALSAAASTGSLEISLKLPTFVKRKGIPDHKEPDIIAGKLIRSVLLKYAPVPGQTVAPPVQTIDRIEQRMVTVTARACHRIKLECSLV